MDEPLKKKSKIEENNLELKLSIFQDHLLGNCLCGLPETENIIQNLSSKCDMKDVSWLGITSSWSRNEKLMFITSIQLVCELAIRQNAVRSTCSNVKSVCKTFTNNKKNLISYFFTLAGDPDRFISFATSRALSSFFLIVNSCEDQQLLDDLTENVAKEHQPLILSFSLDVLMRLIKWKDFYNHALEDASSKGGEGCTVLDKKEEDPIDFNLIKCWCITSLKKEWRDIVIKFSELIKMNLTSYQYSVITFLNLWKAIISVKTNLSIDETKPFYSYICTCVSLLKRNTPPIIWKRILSLLNEVLCYGSTLSLQGSSLPDEPCRLAQTIVRKVRMPNESLLTLVPYREGNGRFGGGEGDGDKVLLKKLVLLVLKAVAVTVLEARCNSSSDSSVGSIAEDGDADMKVIERSIEDVIKRLDKFVKELLHFHPQTELAHWVVSVFVDQDDYMIESMICCLGVSVGLCHRKDVEEDSLHRKLNPCITFLQFSRAVSFDHMVLLDYLVSNETNFLTYIYRYLKYICRNLDTFTTSCGNDFEKVVNLLGRLENDIKPKINTKTYGKTYRYLEPVQKYLKAVVQLVS